MVVEDQEEEEEGKEAGVQKLKSSDKRRWRQGRSRRQALGPHCERAEPAGWTSVGTRLAGCGRRPQHNGPAPLGFLPSYLFGDVPSPQRPWQETVAGRSLVSALSGQNGRRCHHWSPLFSPPPASGREGPREEVWGDQGAVWHPEGGGHVPHVG